MNSGQEAGFVDVYHPASHEELMLLRIAMEGAGIRYFVKNEFATLGSPSAVGSDELSLMVETDRATEAHGLVRQALHD
jgi:hypothetical protein